MQPRRPYMFFLPDPELIKAGCKGDHIKAIIRAVPPSEKYGAERMWIRVTSPRSDWLEGLLDSNPMTPELHGAILRWPRSRVVEVLLGDPARTPPKRKYWVAAFAQTRSDTGESQEPLRTAPTIPIARFDSSATIAAYRRYILLCAPIRCGPERSSDTTSSAQLVHATVRPIRQAIDLAVLPAHIIVLCPFRPPSATGRASMQSLQPQSLW
jgi:hypothetical protein